MGRGLGVGEDHIVNLTGGWHMADLGALATGPQYARPGSPVEARKTAAREFGRKLGTPGGIEGPMTGEVRPNGSKVPVPVTGASAEMP